MICQMSACDVFMAQERAISNQSILKEINPEYPLTHAEAAILQPPDWKSQLTGKDPDAGKDRRQKEKGTTEDGGQMASPTQCT